MKAALSDDNSGWVFGGIISLKTGFFKKQKNVIKTFCRISGFKLQAGVISTFILFTNPVCIFSVREIL